MKKGRMFSVLIAIVMITISFTGCFGDDDDESDNDNEIDNLDNQKGTWITKTPMPSKRHGIGTAVVKDEIYILGGWESNSNEVYDPINNTWNKKSPLPHKHAYPGVAVIKDKIYVIGANEWGGDGYAIDVYDSSADKWTTKKPMPFYRYYFGVGVVNNMIYLIGGHSSVPMDPENETELYYYDSEHVLEYNPII